MFTHKVFRGLLTAVVVALLPLAACDDDPVVEDHEELPEFMELTIGATTVRIDASGSVVAGSLPALTIGTSTTVTARFVADDGDVLELDDEFELRGQSATAGVLTFTSTGRFTGTLAPLAAGQGTIRFELYHTVEQHQDWGPHNVTFTVVAP